MNIATPILIVANLMVGFVSAIPIAKLLEKINNKQKRYFRYFAILIGVYFIECIAIIMGMGIPVFSIGLAIIWGIVFGFWLRKRASRNEVLKTSFFLSFYSSLPAVSFILIPVIAIISGRNIMNAEQGIQFGIPDFLPDPFNTILGFYLAITIGALVLKTVITATLVRLVFTNLDRPGTASSS